MKRLILLLMLAIVSMAGISKDRTATIKTGLTTISPTMVFDAKDTIVTSQTVTYTISNVQQYQQNQAFTATIATVSGSPSVAVTAYGKVTSGGSWVQIGAPVTWTSAGNNPVGIVSASPINYNYLKVTFVASGATQRTKITSFEIKTANNVGNAAETYSGLLTANAGATLKGAAVNINPSSNFATNINTGTTNAALTLGGGSGTVAVNSSDWDITTTGAMTGIGAITSDGLITGSAGATLSGAVINLNASSNFATNVATGSTNAAVSIGGGSNTVAVNSSTWDISSTGVFTGMLRSVVTDATGTVALTAAQTNSILFCTAAGGATTVTIPDPSAATVGVVYHIIQTADQNLVVTATAANGNSIVCDGVATSDNVTISTASHKIGAGMVIIGISATQWYVGGLNPESLLTPEAAD